jgi:hypothetical protein
MEEAAPRRFDPTVPILLTGEYVLTVEPSNARTDFDVVAQAQVNPLINFLTNPSMKGSELAEGPSTSALPFVW